MEPGIIVFTIVVTHSCSNWQGSSASSAFYPANSTGAIIIRGTANGSGTPGTRTPGSQSPQTPSNQGHVGHMTGSSNQGYVGQGSEQVSFCKSSNYIRLRHVNSLLLDQFPC